ncbi:MAG: L-fucose:H+ symporter permease [Chitinophagaceae bacterium]
MALSTINPAPVIAAPGKKNQYVFPLLLVTGLFFLWGLAYGLLDVLNKHFQETLSIDKARSTLLQMSYFGAYFLVALPAGLFMNRYGYKKGIIFGLLLYTTGAFLFYPSAELSSFNFFLLAMFVLAAGLTFLETAANPYVTVLGPAETSAFRLNLSQSFNGVGSFVGPLIAASIFFNQEADPETQLDSVKTVYIVIGVVVLLVALLFWRTRLPEIRESDARASTGSLSAPDSSTQKPLFTHRHFRGAVITQFFYVAAQVGIAALFINYCTENNKSISNSDAAYLLSMSLLLFTLGRFAGTALMRNVAPARLLMIFALVNIGLSVLVVLNQGWISVYSLMAIFFFESIMFPTIFALGLKGLGSQTKKASSFLIMAIVGGAIMPYVMGVMAESFSTASAYGVPILCFALVAWFGWRGSKIL